MNAQDEVTARLLIESAFENTNLDEVYSQHERRSPTTTSRGLLLFWALTLAWSTTVLAGLVFAARWAWGLA